MFLVSERLVLRAVEEKDCSILRELINDPSIEHMIGGKSFPVSEHIQREWILRRNDIKNEARFMIEYEGTAVGTIFLKDIDYINGNAEIHIKIVKNYMGQGIGSEATKILVNYAFCELRLECIYAQVTEYNMSSKKMFEKIGFSVDGILRRRIFKKGNYHNVYILSILKDEIR